jgi:hypothetical protein
MVLTFKNNLQCQFTHHIDIQIRVRTCLSASDLAFESPFFGWIDLNKFFLPMVGQLIC